MKKIGQTVIAVIFIMLICSQPCLAVSTSASAAALIDSDSGRVLYSQNADDERLIASTTKIMTAIVAIENGELDKEITVKAQYAATEGSSMYLKSGEKLRLETLLYGLLLNSGNDAAMVIADAVGNGTDNFVKMMNEKAKSLGMSHTSFANPSGLDDKLQYSSASDMAVLAAYALKNDTFSRIVSTKSITIDGRSFTNHNKLLNMYSGCIGLKTGYTKAAGRTLVSAAEKDNLTLVAVTLNDGNDWDDHIGLFDYGFAAYTRTTLVNVGDRIALERVNGGTLSSVSVTAAEFFAYPLKADEHITRVINIPGSIDAPVLRGSDAGQMRFYLDGNEIGSVKLIYGESVAKAKETIRENRESAGLISRLRTMLPF